MDFIETIGKIRANCQQGKYNNESAVREAIILPVLSLLGWDTLDPQIVLREYSIRGRRVDYALATKPSKPNVIMEVKAQRQIVGGDQQLFEYAFHEGVPLAILTDGCEWSFYLPAEQGSYDDRRVYKLNLTEREPSESHALLLRYLKFEDVKSGAAIEAARTDYKNAIAKREAKNNIPLAWRQLLDEPDELLTLLISERVESLCGYKPSVEEVEEFLVGLSSPVPPQREQPRPVTPSPPKILVNPPTTPGVQALQYQIFGRTVQARNARDALVGILKEIEKRDNALFPKLSLVVQSRSRNHIAKSREEVYPNRPDLADSAMEISPGWWIGLNIANREKKRIIEKACEVAGMTLGKELVINFPNA